MRKLTGVRFICVLLFLSQPQSTAVPTKTRFHALAVHSSTPPSHPVHGRIHSYLERLSTDAGVLHVMALHDYTVGMLTELLPHEHPQLLGLNENKGQRISLRIRTDDYEGTRSYLAVRKVLLHELAHNDVSRTWSSGVVYGSGLRP